MSFTKSIYVRFLSAAATTKFPKKKQENQLIFDSAFFYGSSEYASVVFSNESFIEYEMNECGAVRLFRYFFFIRKKEENI